MEGLKDPGLIYGRLEEEARAAGLRGPLQLLTFCIHGISVVSGSPQRPAVHLEPQKGGAGDLEAGERLPRKSVTSDPWTRSALSGRP